MVEDFQRRTGGRLMNLITTDGYPAYEEAILAAYGETVTPPRTGKRGRPRAAYKVAPAGLTYAVVEKTREKGRVVAIATRVVFGTMAAVIAALGMSTASRAINTSFVERQNATVEEAAQTQIGTQYRAYGLVENYTITGSTVVIGAFAAFAWLWPRTRTRKILLISLFLGILLVGLATTVAGAVSTA